MPVKVIALQAMIAFVAGAIGAWSFDHARFPKPDPMLVESRQWTSGQKAEVHAKIDYLLKDNSAAEITPERFREVLHSIVEAR